MFLEVVNLYFQALERTPRAPQLGCESRETMTCTFTRLLSPYLAGGM